MENTTATPEVEFSDQMKETIAENLNEVLTPVDKDTAITPNGDRYIGITTALRYLQCSKTHFYTVALTNNKVRQKRIMKRVFFNEVDLIEIANAYKIRKSSSFSSEGTNERKDEKQESKQNTSIAIVDSVLKEKEELIKQVFTLNEA